MATTNDKLYIIGIGDNGLDSLTELARRLVEEADLVLGAERTLELVPGIKAAKRAVGTDLEAAVAEVSNVTGRKTVILAEGDPLFYGIARYLCDRLGKDRFEVIPHVSSMQLAFARVKESWDEAYLTNLLARPLDGVIERIRIAEKVGLFTSDESPPAAVAQALLDHAIDYFTAYVCENLGMPDERVTRGELADIAGMSFAPLNVLILVRKPDVPDKPREVSAFRIFGNPEDAFAQSKPKSGLSTRAETRCLALAQLDLHRASTVWDIGAGSGSVAIEAAQLAYEGRVYAIERDLEDYRLILANAERFGVKNVAAVHGSAPAVLADLPEPDAVFVGGTGREVKTLLLETYKRLRPRGRLVVNVASIENLTAAYACLRQREEQVDVWMLNVARGNDQMEGIRFESLNPSFLLAVEKQPAPATR